MDYSRGSIDSVSRPFRGQWEGEDKIVLGIDIGTTQSGVAFAFLQTALARSNNAQAASFGAEALSPEVEEQAKENNWSLARYPKLNLHPEDMKAQHGLALGLLPPGILPRQIYSHFLGYLLKNTKSYFEDRIVDGKRIWQRYSPEMETTIAHPNGWDIREQRFLEM
ncbi:hypothetical protein RhiTH_011494 [Rhizoctonia solani]